VCANNYFTVKRFDKVIAKIQWCSFFAPEFRFLVCSDWQLGYRPCLLIVSKLHYNTVV